MQVVIHTLYSDNVINTYNVYKNTLDLITKLFYRLYTTDYTSIHWVYIYTTDYTTIIDCLLLQI